MNKKTLKLMLISTFLLLALSSYSQYDSIPYGGNNRTFLVHLPTGYTGNTDLPLVIAGKSMGGRVATLLAASHLLPAQVKGVIAFGYPFHPPKKDSWRTEHFVDLKRPVLVLQGDRDPFGSSDELAGKSWPLVDIKWLQSGDHDFSPLKKSGLSQQQLIEQAASLSRSFIDECILEN